MFSTLDRAEVLQVLFHPQRDYGTGVPSGTRLVAVEVEQGVTVGGRLYAADRDAPAILYYHGNGEIAQDYDDLASLYTAIGVTLLVMDYRGYGRSGGSPTAGNLIGDARSVLQVLGSVVADSGLSPARLYVMGRSLGSVPAIDLASQAGTQLAGLIVESGFADTFGLLARLGGRLRSSGEDRDGFGNLTKIGRVILPTLVIHGLADVLIPAAEGQQLYDHCAAPRKRLVLIPRGGHSDLMMVGEREYFGALRRFIHGDADGE
jgi:fermentation-respiration switch protein FrsA (DUF1100 family)